MFTTSRGGPRLVDDTDRLCTLLELGQTLLFTGDLQALRVSLRNAVELADAIALAG